MRPPFRIASLADYADISWKSAKQKSFGFHKSATVFIALRQHGVATAA
jgi:hypothetical protein